ncbi:MAG: cytochrome ubiquinol oxidase subunit I [Candidatus Dormibacteraeota bacterium]|nr:cytochrome ubiquinol oxidase subunit I [Candidatus Dormibacteraeota bacterium]
MDALALGLARWQFGATTLYHFIFVPLTMGLAPLVAIMQTAHLRSRNDEYRRMYRFFGRLFLINFALGVATGLVQEFQFGMNWSAYSSFVGDVFGAPLAIEGLLAFFMESTFLGLWIFGEGRLPEKLHLTTIWLVALGTTLSAIFILAANSWMQHPVGYTIDPQTHRAVMTNFWALLANPVLLVTFPHTMFAAYLTGGLFVLAVAAYHLLRQSEIALFTRAARIGLIWSLVAAVLLGFSGHAQAQIMTDVQPMKMAAAEALYQDQAPADFSVLAIGTPDGKHLIFNPTIPRLLSVLATNTLDGRVEGIDNIQARYQQQYGPGDYTPIIPVTYWTFRLMVAVAFVLGLLALVGLWLLYRGRLETTRWFLWASMGAVALPFLGNWFGWIFTEMGRQPWVVFGLLKTTNGVSTAVGSPTVAISFAAFTLLYGGLAVLDGWLMAKVARAGPVEEEDGDGESEAVAMTF